MKGGQNLPSANFSANALGEMHPFMHLDAGGMDLGVFKGPNLFSASLPALVSSTQNKTLNDSANGSREP